MALHVFLFSKLFLQLTILTLILTNTNPVLCYYNTIFTFGDSLTDTGNLFHLEVDDPSFTNRPPYGMTYFHHPTGRCSDGRLIIDFIAEALGFPFLPPCLAPGQDFRQGANFAVVGATAMELDSYDKRGISMEYQIGWFKDLLPSLCDPFTNCQDFLKKSLFFVGEIGGNDYHSLFEGISIVQVQQTIVPKVINVISSTIQTLINLGVVMLVVPGITPLGCLTFYLTYFQSPNKEDYEPQTGCLKRFNEFTIYHNHLLQQELHRLQELHPHATISYADYYNAAMLFHLSPHKYGFSKGALIACCGSGGPYNYNSSVPCGDLGSLVCEEPSLYANWDGLHLTEAAYKTIATSLLEGPYAIPLLNVSHLHLASMRNERHPYSS